jgi:hypothetical protein
MMNRVEETIILCKMLMYNYVKTPHRMWKYVGKDSIRMSPLELWYENINCIGLNEGSVL